MTIAPTQHYDAIIIGASRAAIHLGAALAQAGRRTALIDRKYLGGTCVNVGCTPTKTMAASARVAHVARRAAEYGVRAGEVTVELAAVRKRKDDLVGLMRTLPEGLIAQIDELDFVRGTASFTGAKSVQVAHDDGTVRALASDMFFIDTGARSFVPPIPGLNSVPTLDSTSIMELDMLPDHLLILGGGYVGVEFAQMYRRFGSQVTIVQRDGQLLSREDPDVAQELTTILREEGVQVLLGSTAAEARRTEGGLELVVESDDGTKTLSGSHLLVAVGRVPNTDGLEVAAAGVETDERGFVRVNERLETNVPGIYAFGDVTPGPAFTHAAFDDFRVLSANILRGAGATVTGRVIPYVVFTDPQLGRVGLSETDARQQGRSIRVAKLPMNYMGPTRAQELGETRGLLKVVVDAETDEILGAAVLSVEGGEVMAVLQVAMMGQLPYTAIRDAIFAHPTLVESLNDLFMSLDMPRQQEGVEESVEAAGARATGSGTRQRVAVGRGA
jgi:pyruvate/2-oxoglutarate dehydrogenase complex dihydrolipoamide dehydrogenase (E3) component